uniref:trans-resveratrol di-O-methyltransferase-like n=1 Tax=Erigeron canadensis TaxID=72917 RepID=UPI001CB8DF6D|nr:trans-resveratrol di-O-methyltransferase-like [Erigeron canadensis]
MVSQHDEQCRDLLHSQAHIWSHIFSFIKPMSLKCAIQLQIPDIINDHGSPMLLSELVDALSINKERTPFVHRLMRILVHSGFFVKQNIGRTRNDEKEEDNEENKGYLLAPASRYLLKEESLSLRPFLLAMLDPKLMNPWQDMSKWFKNGDVNPCHTTHGSVFWEHACHESGLNHFFNEAMASDSRLVTTVILKHCTSVFQGLNSIVDVGCGTGTVVKAIAEALPNVSCIGFDLPHVIRGLVGSKNLSYVSGDMFQAIPKADAVLLKWILHDWSDQECIKILKQCREAIPSKENGGKLIIIDMVLKDNPQDNQSLETQLFFDMLMMTLTTGRERSEKEWAQLFLDASFSEYKIFPILGSRSLIEVYP